ncbi:MAG: DUF2007 domain-containing protein [bacterium]
MFCPKCRAEYVAGITVCADCDVPLVDRLPEEGKYIHTKLKYVEVLITSNVGELVLVKSVLDDAGIEYFIRGEHLQIAYSAADPARLMVREDYVKEVQKILQQLIQKG